MGITGSSALGFADTPHIDQLAAAGMRFTSLLMFYYPNFHMTTPAIREGDWKLINYLGQDRTELYDLAEDLGEQNDLSSKQPDVATALRNKLADHLRDLGAQMPRPNPNQDPKKADTWGPRIKGDRKWNNIP